MKIDKSKLILSMIIFGTVGLVRRYIPYSSGTIAMIRGFSGMIFLLAVCFIGKRKISWQTIKQNLPLLCLSGAFLGLNWILLFEAYRFTSVATATICYYMSPVIIILSSPFIFGERLTAKKAVCVLIAAVGMATASGIFEADFSGAKGILFGLGAAVMYGALVIANKKMPDIGAIERTVFQLGTAAVVLLPYVILTESKSLPQINGFIIAMLLTIGIVHTGIAYALYFGSINKLSAQTTALLSYIDPVTAICVSALILRENVSVCTIIGAAAVIGSAIISEKR